MINNCVFYVVGMKSDNELFKKIADKAPLVDLIGDCRMVGRVGDATHSGFFAAMDIGSF